MKVEFVTSAVVEKFFDGSTRDRTLSGARTLELLESYVKSRSREESKRSDASDMREYMKIPAFRAEVAKMREALKK